MFYARKIKENGRNVNEIMRKGILS